MVIIGCRKPFVKKSHAGAWRKNRADLLNKLLAFKLIWDGGDDFAGHNVECLIGLQEADQIHAIVGHTGDASLER